MWGSMFTRRAFLEIFYGVGIIGVSKNDLVGAMTVATKQDVRESTHSLTQALAEERGGKWVLQDGGNFILIMQR